MSPVRNDHQKPEPLIISEVQIIPVKPQGGRVRIDAKKFNEILEADEVVLDMRARR